MTSDEPQTADSSDSADPAAPAQRRKGFGRLKGSAVVAILVAGGFLWAALGRDNLAPLTKEALEEAEQAWKRAAPPNYELEVTLSGKREGVFRVVVRNGEPIEGSLDGVATKERVWDVWTVRGQFNTLWQELENAADADRAYAVKDPASVVMRAQFDPEWHFPRRYWRSVLGANLDVAWEVTRFTPQ